MPVSKRGRSQNVNENANVNANMSANDLQDRNQTLHKRLRAKRSDGTGRGIGTGIENGIEMMDSVVGQKRKSTRLQEKVKRERLVGEDGFAIRINDDLFHFLGETPLYSSLENKSIKLDAPQIFVEQKGKPVLIQSLQVDFRIKLPIESLMAGSNTIHDFKSIVATVFLQNPSSPESMEEISFRIDFDWKWFTGEKQKASSEILRIYKHLFSYQHKFEQLDSTKSHGIETIVSFNINLGQNQKQRIGPGSLSTLLPVLSPYFLIAIMIKYASHDISANTERDIVETIESIVKKEDSGLIQDNNQDNSQIEYNSNAFDRTHRIQEAKKRLAAQIKDLKIKHENQLRQDIADARQKFEEEKTKIETEKKEKENKKKKKNNATRSPSVQSPSSSKPLQSTQSATPSHGSTLQPSSFKRQTSNTQSHKINNSLEKKNSRIIIDQDLLYKKSTSLSQKTIDFLNFASKQLDMDFILSDETNATNETYEGSSNLNRSHKRKHKNVLLNGDAFMEFPDVLNQKVFYNRKMMDIKEAYVMHNKHENNPETETEMEIDLEGIKKEMQKLIRIHGNLNKDNVAKLGNLTLN